MGALVDLGRLFHFGWQMDRVAGNHERTLPEMMNRLRMFRLRVDPGLDHLKDKEVVFGYHFLIDDFAFKIDMALVDERRLDARGGYRSKIKLLELVDRPVVLPQPTTCSASSTVGILITHSLVAFTISKV